LRIRCSFNLRIWCRARRIRKQRWHNWFAWRPVRVSPTECRWLESVMRRGKATVAYPDGGTIWRYQYKAKRGCK